MYQEIAADHKFLTNSGKDDWIGNLGFYMVPLKVANSEPKAIKTGLILYVVLIYANERQCLTVTFIIFEPVSLMHTQVMHTWAPMQVHMQAHLCEFAPQYYLCTGQHKRLLGGLDVIFISSPYFCLKWRRRKGLLCNPYRVLFSAQ